MRSLLVRRVPLAVLAAVAVWVAGCGSSSAPSGDSATPSTNPSLTTDSTAETNESTTESSDSASGSSEAASSEASEGSAISLPADIAAAGVIKVAADMHYPPADYYDADGTTPAGADYEVGQAIGEVLGVEMKVSDVTFDNIIPGLKSGQYDMAVTFMTDTVERQDVVDFVDAYQSGSSMLVKKGNPENIQVLTDLCGKTITTTKTSVQIPLAKAQDAECAKLGKDPIDILTVNTDIDALLQVKSGRASADLAETVAASYNAATSNDGNDFEVVGPVYDPHLVGMVTLKGKDQLRDAVAAALEQMMTDGTYMKILEKYGLTAIAIDKVTINGTKDK